MPAPFDLSCFYMECSGIEVAGIEFEGCEANDYFCLDDLIELAAKNPHMPVGEAIQCVCGSREYRVFLGDIYCGDSTEITVGNLLFLFQVVFPGGLAGGPEVVWASRAAHKTVTGKHVPHV